MIHLMMVCAVIPCQEFGGAGGVHLIVDHMTLIVTHNYISILMIVNNIDLKSDSYVIVYFYNYLKQVDHCLTKYLC
jgi:hypothetical protein